MVSAAFSALALSGPSPQPYPGVPGWGSRAKATHWSWKSCTTLQSATAAFDDFVTSVQYAIATFLASSGVLARMESLGATPSLTTLWEPPIATAPPAATGPADRIRQAAANPPIRKPFRF